jgi:hypothetical protein
MKYAQVAFGYGESVKSGTSVPEDLVQLCHLEGETEAQKEEMTCPKETRRLVVEPGPDLLPSAFPCQCGPLCLHSGSLELELTLSWPAPAEFYKVQRLQGTLLLSTHHPPPKKKL